MFAQSSRIQLLLSNNDLLKIKTKARTENTKFEGF